MARATTLAEEMGEMSQPRRDILSARSPWAPSRLDLLGSLSILNPNTMLVRGLPIRLYGTRGIPGDDRVACYCSPIGDSYNDEERSDDLCTNVIRQPCPMCQEKVKVVRTWV